MPLFSVATTSLTFTEAVTKRFDGYGWHTQTVADGNDVDALTTALAAARAATDRPSLIAVRTTIGYGAPHKQGTSEVHGNPLGPDELRAAKRNLGWPEDQHFLIPGEALEHFRMALTHGAEAEAMWEKRLDDYAEAHPALAAALRRRLAGDLPEGWGGALPNFPADVKGPATRKASEKVIQALGVELPELMGGSADLNPSTFTVIKDAGDFQSVSLSAEGAQGTSGGAWDYTGRNLHFGVREHGMGAIVNGMALHGGFIPYGSTFLVFSDYMRGALRLSAIMHLGCVWVFTHDSIGLGEDGPTHQAVEHYAALRAIPNLLFIRPADANEVTAAWQVAIENRHRPTSLALTRQAVPTLDRAGLAPAEGLRHGAYVLNPSVTDPQIILIATGSEVQHIVAAEKNLAAQGIRARLVSMPCWELFEEQPAEYRNAVLPPAVTARLAVEAGVSLGWRRWVGDRGATITLDGYGASAPFQRLMKEFGFTPENVVAHALALLGRT